MKTGEVTMTLVDWLHGTAYATTVRESQTIYPLLQSVHILGISMFAGAVAMVNLRLAGAGQSIPLTDFARYAMRVGWFGLILILMTGMSMAVGFVDVFVVSGVMWAKLTLVAFAIANAVIIQRNGVVANAPWAHTPPDSGKVRKWAAVGIVILLAIVTLGKLLAYIGGKD
jgi:hypothetical protein